MYSERYYFRIKDRQANPMRLSLLEKGYGGAGTEVTDYERYSLKDRKRGGRQDSDNVVIGGELEFSWLSKKTDFNVYDSIFESEYKDWMGNIMVWRDKRRN